MAQEGSLLTEGQEVRVELPADPADFAESSPPQRWLDVTVLSVDRHVPESVHLRLTEENEEER